MIRMILGMTLLSICLNSYAIGPGGTRSASRGMGIGTGGFTPPAGIVVPPCVATRTCTPADFAGLLPPSLPTPPTPPALPTPPSGVTPPSIPACVATRSCTRADFAGLLPPGLTPPPLPAAPVTAP